MGYLECSTSFSCRVNFDENPKAKELIRQRLIKKGDMDFLDNNKSEVMVYPTIFSRNSNREFKVHSSDAIVDVSVISASGKLILKSSITNEDAKFASFRLSNSIVAGIYIIRVTTNEGHFSNHRITVN
jgi:hypothetical protein